MATWNKAAEPDASAVPYTVALTPPMVTVTLLAAGYEPAGTATPTGAGGLVGPKPVPHRIRTSPGLAGPPAGPREGRLVAAENGPAGTATPTGAGGLVGPKPVPHRIRTSPGLAGTVVVPGNVPFLRSEEHTS